ncbi:hypothetical protein BJ322DRAFT_1025872, partial [Thelephora terrestris]
MDLRAKCARLQREVHDAHPRKILIGLRDAIYDTKDNVQKIAEHIAANYTGEIPGIGTFGIPLNPKQDEFGVPVSADVKEEVQGDLTAYWVDMLQDGKLPVHYSGLGLNRREDFRKTMEEKYPWLRLCEGHWKVRQIWVNYYRKSRILAIIENDPTLKKKFAAILPDPRYPGDILGYRRFPAHWQSKEEEGVLVISSEAEDGSPAPGNTTNEAPVRASNPTIDPEPMESSGPSAGSKRGRPESDDMRPASPKKSKGKGKATATTNFHPPKAQPKKNTAKIGKIYCTGSLATLWVDFLTPLSSSKVKVTQPAQGSTRS